MTPIGWLLLAGASAVLPTERAVRLERVRASMSAGGTGAFRAGADESEGRRFAFRRSGDRRAALLAAVRLLASELGGGARPADALTAAGSIDRWHRAVFDAAEAAQRCGEDAAAVLRADPDTAFVGHAWAVAMTTGAPAADVLSRAARDCADRLELRRAVRTALAGARASATVMAVLPVLGVVLGAAMGAHPLATLFGSKPGRVCLAVGLALDAAGVLWTTAIARRAMRS